jgi:hypothetical protein
MKTKYTANKKIIARSETIIDQFRDIYDLDSLPIDKQYWSICASNSNIDSTILKGGEYDQVLNSGLISSQQFYGVDIVPNIINNNIVAIPDANWICGDFYETMVEFNGNNRFHPGIVNCDMLVSPKYGSNYVSKILSLLNDGNFNDVMFVSNLILKSYTWEFTEDQLVDMLLKQPGIKHAINSGWKIKNQVYTYWGSFGKRSKMGSVIFYNKNQK